MKRPARKILSVATAALVCGASLISAAPSGYAADYLIDDSVTVTPVEFGTGWYIRGDIGLTDANTLRFSETASIPAGTGRIEVQESDIDTAFSGGIGIGTRLSPNIRLDLGYDYMAESSFSRRGAISGPTYPAPCGTASSRTSVDSDGDGSIDTILISPTVITNCTSEDQSSFFLQSLIATGYYDFDQSFFGLRPFVGAGGGLIRNQYTSTLGDVTCVATDETRCGPTDGGVTDFGDTYTQEGIRNNGTAYHLAGSLVAGLSYSLSDTLHIDTSYRYTHMFEDPLWGGSNGVEDAGVPTDFHTIKVGFRLDIW